MTLIQVPIKQDLSERVDYIIPQYPVYIRKGCLSTYPSYKALSHWHEDIEFIYVLHGEMNYDVNGTITTIHSGEGIIINSGNFHCGFSDEQKECEFICILIHPSLFASNAYIQEKYLRLFTECTGLPFILLEKLDWHKEIAALLQKMLALDQKSDDFFLSCQILILSILQLLYNHTKSELQQEPQGSLQTLTSLRQMVHYIQSHYSEPLTLKDIAAVGNMSKTSCCNAFNTYMHTTPIDYLLKYRMSQSYKMVLETELPITEIAYAAGFHDSSYFTKYFREYYGKTPREIRKEGKIHILS